MKEHFSLPNVAYVGSDLNCGCGFRNVSFQNGGWPGEWLIEQEQGDIDAGGRDRDKNHQELHELLSRILETSDVLELYGCWADDFKEKTEGEQELALECILSERFHFRERVVYRVRRNS